MSSAVSERHHRATRSGRCLAAAGLIAIMAGQTGYAVAAAAGSGFALVVNLILGTAAAVLVRTVVADVRRAAGAERAASAVRTAAQARERSQEHTAFVAALGRQLRDARADAAQAHSALSQARSAAEQWSARTRELEARLSDAETELVQLRDALWVSEAAEKRARAELVIAEQQPRHLRPA